MFITEHIITQDNIRPIQQIAIIRLIVDPKAEHPALSLNEIAGICYVRTGRKPHPATVRSVLEEEPLPIKAFKRFPPYHEMPEGSERRKAVAVARSGRKRLWAWTSRS